MSWQNWLNCPGEVPPVPLVPVVVPPPVVPVPVPPVPAPLVPLPVDVPPDDVAPPLVPELVPDELLELELGEEGVAGVALVVEVVLVVDVALAWVELELLTSASDPGGTVSCGVDFGGTSLLPLLPPHAATASPDANTNVIASTAGRGSGMRKRLGGGQDAASGPIRRPHVGQSLRSRWASWSHHGQKRRFSTAHGSRELVGASGTTIPTTSSSSPVSRSV